MCAEEKRGEAGGFGSHDHPISGPASQGAPEPAGGRPKKAPAAMKQGQPTNQIEKTRAATKALAAQKSPATTKQHAPN